MLTRDPTRPGMLTSEIRSRIEPELKDEAQAVLGRVGLNISDAIRLFLRQVVATRGLPFEVREYPNATTQAAMHEARETRARYGSAQELTDGLRRRRAKKKRPHKAVR
jgi:DNA-damage-inducible protein J